MNDPLNPQSGYKVPKGNSPHLSFEIGDTEFLPLDSAIIGYEYWTNDNKPVRLSEVPANPATLPNIKAEIDEKTGRTIYRVSHFWAFPVIDIDDGRVKVLKITQNGIQKAITAYVKNPKWGSPVMKYTITVSRTGTGFDTEYNVMANPTPSIPEAYAQAWQMAKDQGFSLQRWFEGGEVYDGPHTEASYTSVPAPEELSAAESIGIHNMPQGVVDARNIELKPEDVPFPERR